MGDDKSTKSTQLPKPQLPKLAGPDAESTQTIGFDGLFGSDVTSSDSFDLTGVEATSLGRLLQALPVPALLTDRSKIVTFVNRATGRLSSNYERIKGQAFCALFRKAEEASLVRSLIDEVFATRKPRIHEGIVEFETGGIWGRIHFLPISIGLERSAMILVEDLTFEKRQLLLTEKHREELSLARDELEARVKERTAELRDINERLLQEIGEREVAELELQKGKDRIDALLNATTDMAYLLSADGRFLAMNEAGAKLFRRPAEQLLGKQAFELLPPPMAKKMRTRFEEILRAGHATRFDQDRDGTVFDISVYPVHGPQGEIAEVAVFARDITNRRRVEQRLRLSANIIESVNEGVLVTDPSGGIVYVNQAFVRLTGYSREEVLGKNPRIMKSDRHDGRFYRRMWKTLEKKGRWQGEIWDRKKSGELYPKLLSITALKDSVGQVLYYVGVFSDITGIKRTEKRLRRLAHYDPLTRLPNRVLFRDRLQQALFRAARDGLMVALLYLDLDGFKHINDTMGHRVGDELLIEVAGRLIACLRKGDTVARMGGDEFTVVVSDLSSMHGIAEVARKITEEMSRPFVLREREAFVSASAGIAVYPDDGSDADTLLQNADIAMYHAKEEGKNRFVFFSEEMNLAIRERLDLETSLRTALERNELVVLYQPIVDLASGTVTEVEALLRWNHPTSGLMLPDLFLPPAEDHSLIVPMGQWIIERACRDMIRWRAMDLRPVRLAVNVAGAQLKEHGFPGSVMDIVRKAGLQPSDVGLEMTESVLIGDPDANPAVFRKLKQKGFRIMVDDFGAGGSPLGYLKRAAIDEVKIDRSFISTLDTDPDAQAVVSAIIGLAHNLRMKVTAEGVENEAQLRILRDLQCDHWQGDYFSPPMTAKQIARILGENP